MNPRYRRGLIVALLLSLPAAAWAGERGDVMKEAARLLEEIAASPDCGIPIECFQTARGITILPHIVETNVGVGRKHGYGIFLSRDEKGVWGHAEPFELSGTSLGAEAGRVVSDIVIIYQDRKAADDYGGTYFRMELGLDIKKARRPKRVFHPSITYSHKNTIAFTRNSGFLAGVRLSSERRWGPSFVPADQKPAAKTDDQVARASVKAEAHLGAKPRNSISPRSRDLARIEALLSELSNRPPASVEAKKKKGAKVQPATGTPCPTPARTVAPPQPTPAIDSAATRQPGAG